MIERNIALFLSRSGLGTGDRRGETETGLDLDSFNENRDFVVKYLNNYIRRGFCVF